MDLVPLNLDSTLSLTVRPKWDVLTGFVLWDSIKRTLAKRHSTLASTRRLPNTELITNCVQKGTQ